MILCYLKQDVKYANETEYFESIKLTSMVFFNASTTKGIYFKFSFKEILSSHMVFATCNTIK